MNMANGAVAAETPQSSGVSSPTATASSTAAAGVKPKLHGREFYRSIGSPKYIVAPMVDRSEFAWRMLTRSYMPPVSPSSSTEGPPPMLAYTPMLHARLFKDGPKFRNDHFQPTRSSVETPSSPTYPPSSPAYLDGNPAHDRPLIVQFCANSPAHLLEAARYVAPFCDAVDLNLGCPQGIARNGRYGAFLQESPELIAEMISTLHRELSVPVTAKMRILDTPEQTLAYAQTILAAGASILTVHGRRREQKGHNTGLADWAMIRYLRDNLPADTVLFANGNVLGHDDLHACLATTGADGVMSAEGNLSDPTIFAAPPTQTQLDQDPVLRREYWFPPTAHRDTAAGGYRLDGVIRRYLDIIYRFVLERPAPDRPPLWIPGDPIASPDSESEDSESRGPPAKKRKKDHVAMASPSLRPIQGHLFGLLRPMLSSHTDIRDALARIRVGELEGFERMLGMVEQAVREGIQKCEETGAGLLSPEDAHRDEELTPSQKTARIYARPWWIAQPYIRPLPEEALASGALKVSKKAIEQGKVDVVQREEAKDIKVNDAAVRRSDETIAATAGQPSQAQPPLPASTPTSADETSTTHEATQPALVCG